VSSGAIEIQYILLIKLYTFESKTLVHIQLAIRHLNVKTGGTLPYPAGLLPLTSSFHPMVTKNG